MTPTYTIYIGEDPERPQGTIHIGNFIRLELQPLTGWNAATVQEEKITQDFVRFSFTKQKKFKGRVHRFAQMGI